MTLGRWLTAVVLVPWLLAGCSTAGTADQWAHERVVKAEAEMNFCKESIGLASSPTPTTTALYDSGTGPVAQDAAQVKIKTLCGRQLRELLDAQRALKELRRGAGAGG